MGGPTFEPELVSASSSNFNLFQFCAGATMSSQLTPLFAEIRDEAFPVLTAEQISRIRPLSKVRNVKVGDILFEPGDSDVPFFVLLSGRMEIVQPDWHGERPIVNHEPGEFTGEMSMVSGRRCLVRGRVTE